MMASNYELEEQCPITRRGGSDRLIEAYVTQHVKTRAYTDFVPFG